MGAERRVEIYSVEEQIWVTGNFQERPKVQKAPKIQFSRQPLPHSDTVAGRRPGWQFNRFGPFFGPLSGPFLGLNFEIAY